MQNIYPPNTTSWTGLVVQLYLHVNIDYSNCTVCGNMVKYLPQNITSVMVALTESIWRVWDMISPLGPHYSWDDTIIYLIPHDTKILFDTVLPLTTEYADIEVVDVQILDVLSQVLLQQAGDKSLEHPAGLGSAQHSAVFICKTHII